MTQSPDKPFTNVYTFGNNGEWYATQIPGSQVLEIYKRIDGVNHHVESLTMSNSNWMWHVTTDGTGIIINGIGQNPVREFWGVEKPTNDEILAVLDELPTGAIMTGNRITVACDVSKLLGATVSPDQIDTAIMERRNNRMKT